MTTFRCSTKVIIKSNNKCLLVQTKAFLYEWDRPGCRIDFFYGEHLMNEALKTLSGTCKRPNVPWGCLITVYISSLKHSF